MWDSIVRNISRLGFSLISAAILLYVGFWVIKRVNEVVKKLLKSRNFDPTIAKFIESIISILLKVFLIVAAIDMVGIDTTGFIAVLGGISLAVGLAFQGALSNLAGGLLLIFFKPIKVGDFVDISGQKGTVDSIQILSTKLITVDNKVIFIPNGKVTNSDLVNYSALSTRRIDQFYSVDYKSNIETVKKILNEEISKQDAALKTPEPFVALNEHGDSALIFAIRVWVKSEDYWTVHFSLLENIKKRFDEEKINIPYPVVDVRLPNKSE